MIKIWCDASIRRVGKNNINRRRKSLCFVAFITDQGHHWHDVMYARNSHEGELSAVISALAWALEQGYDQIIINTDDRSICGSLQGRHKKGLGDLPRMIAECAAEINIMAVPRAQNRAAHHLCRLAYQEYAQNRPVIKLLNKISTDSVKEAVDRARLHVEKN